jgi:hypothetical protein
MFFVSQEKYFFCDGDIKYQISDFKKLSTNNSQSGAVRELEILSFSLVGE